MNDTGTQVLLSPTYPENKAVFTPQPWTTGAASTQYLIAPWGLLTLPEAPGKS